MAIERVVVVGGGGVMGSGIAQVVASAGLEVTIVEGDEAAILPRLADADVLVSMGFTRPMAEAGPRLRLVQVPGHGEEVVLVPVRDRRGAGRRNQERPHEQRGEQQQRGILEDRGRPRPGDGSAGVGRKDQGPPGPAGT